jgi:hypothetical protein
VSGPLRQISDRRDPALRALLLSSTMLIDVVRFENQG